MMTRVGRLHRVVFSLAVSSSAANPTFFSNRFFSVSSRGDGVWRLVGSVVREEEATERPDGPEHVKDQRANTALCK